MQRVHIVGAGLAGLSAALRLTEAGMPVTVYEAAGHAGGRCRSYFDDTLGRDIDNGNHLLMSGNRSAMAYLRLIGAEDTLLRAPRALFPFVDLRTGQQWTVRLNRGPIPWWIFSPSRRVADTRAMDYLGGLRLAVANRDATVADLFGRNPTLFERFWEPLAVAALNTSAREGAAALLWPIMTETLGRGDARSRPCIARHGLSRSFVDPALAWLRERGADVVFNRRVRGIGFEGRRAGALEAGKNPVTLGPGDSVVLAVPPTAAQGLVPGLTAPTDARPIVNAHFLLDRAIELPGGLPLLGLVGGTAQWLFVREDIVSVTISAAEAEVGRPAASLAKAIWSDITRACGLGDDPLPKYRIVKEKRATFAQTPDQMRRRPEARTAYANLVIAGDWTDTRLPATIEGAIRSGENAAKLLRAAR